MNTGIGFRVWDIKRKKYVESVAIDNKGRVYEVASDLKTCEDITDHAIVEPFANKRDTKNRKIYQGSILKATSRYADIDTEISYVTSCISNIGLSNSWYDEQIYDYEVIGDVHHSPELWEKQK